MQIKFSFNNKSKTKRMNGFQIKKHTQTKQQNESKTDVNDEEKEEKQNNDASFPMKHKNPFKFDETESTSFEDPCSIFNKHYSNAIFHATSGDYPESLRSFDIAIRFWGLTLERYKQKNPNIFKKLSFPDIKGNPSDYFLKLKNKKKNESNKKIKKKLWKPPPKNQLSSNDNNNQKTKHKMNLNESDNDDDDDIDIDIDINDNNDEIIYFDEKKEKGNNDIEIKELILKHREIGSEMYEYHGQVLLEMDRDFEAIKACQQSIILNELKAINWLTLSRAELNFGDAFQALKSISRGIELDFENDEIIEHYSSVYAICDKLTKMNHIGKISDGVLKRRLITKCSNCQHQNDIKTVQKRLEKRGKNEDDIGRLSKQTDVEFAVNNYQQMIKMTKTMQIDEK